MILTDYIKMLQKLEADGYGTLTVRVDDWNEEYSRPSEDQAEIVVVVTSNTKYYQTWTDESAHTTLPFVCIAPRESLRE